MFIGSISNSQNCKKLVIGGAHFFRWSKNPRPSWCTRPKPRGFGYEAIMQPSSKQRKSNEWLLQTSSLGFYATSFTGYCWKTGSGIPFNSFKELRTEWLVRIGRFWPICKRADLQGLSQGRGVASESASESRNSSHSEVSLFRENC